MLNWISRFMTGRYGFDKLGTALALGSACVMIFANLFGSGVLAVLAYIIAGICIYRIMSKRITLRLNENRRFLKICSDVNAYMKRDRKAYKYFKCPKCRTTVKVPRGKGKIVVRCRFCNEEFMKKS